LEDTKSLEVLAPGPLTTVQDLGRPGFGRYGVPPSGALDTFSLRVANLLVGNGEGEAGLEITLMGLRVKALTDLNVAVTGGDLQPHRNDAPLEMWRSLRVRRGDILHFKAPRTGCRAYLSAGGGICVPSVLGSKSTNCASRFGGLEGRPLQKGDILTVNQTQRHLAHAGRALDRSMIPRYSRQWHLRVLFGPQKEDFTDAVKKRFLHGDFEVTPQTDRMGIRLAGPLLERKEGLPESIISEGVVSGTIQVPGDAQPIIILVETVTGGYRKIATVISADLPRLGQIKPGDRVSFQAVSLQQALEALERVEAIIARLKEDTAKV
jgi:antagonist of KipI